MTEASTDTNRTVGCIIAAVQTQQPCTERELRLTIMALAGALALATPAPRRLNQIAYYHLREQNDFEMSFRLMKQTPEKWLGPDGLPESEEYQRRRRIGVALYEKAGARVKEKTE